MLLISVMNLWEVGDTRSGNLCMLYLFEAFHSFFHLKLIFLLCSCLSTKVLFLIFFLMHFGSSFTGEVLPSAARLASLSAFSFPLISVCPAIQQIMRSYAPPFLHSATWFASVMNSAAKYWPGLISSNCRAMIAAWLSAPMVHWTLPLFSIFIR